MNFQSNSRPFFLLILVSFVLVLILSWHKYFINKDYLLYAQVTCDETEVGSCFFNEENDYRYKIIYYLAKAAPRCEPERGGCQELSCPAASPHCQTIFCTEETLKKLNLSDQCR